MRVVNLIFGGFMKKVVKKYIIKRYGKVDGSDAIGYLASSVLEVSRPKS